MLFAQIGITNVMIVAMPLRFEEFKETGLALFCTAPATHERNE